MKSQAISIYCLPFEILIVKGIKINEKVGKIYINFLRL